MNQKPQDNVILYTFFTPDVDITKEDARSQLILSPHEEQTAREMKAILGWDLSCAAFTDLDDFTSGYFNVPYVANMTAWILSVPASEIRWAAFSLYQNEKVPLEQIFFHDPETIRALPDIPTAFVRLPVKPEWVLRTAYPGRNLLTGRAWA